MRAAITGAAGFVGANLARRLLGEGHDVTLLVRPGTDTWRLDDLRDGAVMVDADVTDAASVAQAFADARPEWVFHLAVHGAYASQRDDERIIRTNVLGTVHVVEAAIRAGADVVVNTGSSSEYGFKDHAPSEDEPAEPNSVYAVGKLAATTYCRQRAGRVRIPTLRLSSVYGPFEEPGRLMPTLIAEGLRGRLPPLVDPDVARDYVWVDDVCDAYLRAAAAPLEDRGAIYNVGSGVQTTLREIVDVARRTLGVGLAPEWGTMPNRGWDTTVWVCNPAKIREELGWTATIDREQGFAAFVEWFRAHPDLIPRYVS